jgi:enoyl-CoA hydratase/carnithine racemase
MDDATVLVERARVATLTLNRPGVLNAFDWALREALTDALRVLNADDTVRAIVITGAGERAFSAGQDLEEAAGYGVNCISDWMAHQREMYQMVRSFGKPVVVAFNGLAAGSGFHLGLLADLRVGFAEMSMGQPEIRMGMASIVGPYLMSHHLGQAQISELSVSGRMISGERAHRLGLLNEMVPKGEVLARAHSLASQLAEHPSEAMGLTKAYFAKRTQDDFDCAFAEVVRCHQIEYATGIPQALMRQFLGRQRSS